MKRLAALVLVALLFSLLGDHVTAGEAKGKWQATWDKTLLAAKREGRVVIYHGPGATSLPIKAGIFQKRFPEIKVVSVSGEPERRVLAERRADKYLVDVIMGGATAPLHLYFAKALDPIPDAMMLPEVVDESRWWGGKHHYTDPERKYVFVYIGKPDFGTVYYNTNIVDPGELQSLSDFLRPKWKGKISARDVRIPGTGRPTMRMFYYHPKLGAEYIRRLFGETDITLFRDDRQGVDWLATGRYPICFFCSPTEIGRAKHQGLPVDTFGLMKEGAGISSASGGVGIVNRAPYPNAAKVFLNWLLSREGQLTMQTEYAKALAGSSNSLRIDIPKDMVPAAERLQDGIDYIEVETPERMSLEPIFKVLNEALAKAGK